jgi:8-oxo-dGTP pyrophosphatase MutT (NUDIX family)
LLKNSHAREVSFPGGKCDSKEETDEEAALRETHEELGIHPDDVTVWTKMPAISNHTG